MSVAGPRPRGQWYATTVSSRPARSRPLSQRRRDRSAAEAALAESPVAYPYSDGLFLIEADPQANAVIAVRNQLGAYFKDRSDVYLAGNLAVYYEQGNRRAVVAPDVLVAFGVSKRDRKSYRVWEEGGRSPDFVLEVASPSTESRDRTEKVEDYARMGVREYWRFDPTGEHFEPRLQAGRLAGWSYERLAGRTGATRALEIRSEVLGLDVRADGKLLRFRDPRTGTDLLTHLESELARERAERARSEAESALVLAERRVADLEAMLESASDRRAPGAFRSKS